MMNFNYNQFAYNPRRKTMVAEASTLQIPAGKMLTKFEIQGVMARHVFCLMQEVLNHAGDDCVAGWEFRSPTTDILVVIIND
jgi:hypothetical protein